MEFYLSSYFTGKALFCGSLNYPCKFFLYRLNFVSSLLDNCIGNIPTQALHYKACQICCSTTRNDHLGGTRPLVQKIKQEKFALPDKKQRERKMYSNS